MGLKESLQSLLSKKPKVDEQPVTEEQQEMIKGVMELPETTVKEVMVPRTDSIFIDVETEQDELIKTICESGHSRFPVFKDTIDNVIGILYSKDILTHFYKTHDEKIDIEALIRKPYFVPLTKHVHELLRELRRRKVHIAVVVDEYGGVAGIVCMEDIIEEIIGDIQDEFDNEKEDVLSIGGGVWLCDARVNLEDLNEETGLELPTEDFDTLGGFVFDLFGKIPVRYEKTTWNNIDFIVQEMDGHKINSVKIIRKE
ncbi:MAG: hemolysin family protein [Spirochaetaceae bacterium]|jgi:CBS domain containing-hemolysin-like protein|nr:hemolysin family protein [Spirochaetaceae bacterium]